MKSREEWRWEFAGRLYARLCTSPNSISEGSRATVAIVKANVLIAELEKTAPPRECKHKWVNPTGTLIKCKDCGVWK